MRYRAARVVLIAVLPIVASCTREAERPPIIVISVDTLRADRLPMYGYRGVDTPALDALRRDAVLFRNAWSHSPLTLPSHATMLTGQLPATHGVRDNLGFRLAVDVPTVAALVRANGYQTGAAVSAFVLRASTGMNAGFDLYDDDHRTPRGERSIGRIQRSGDATAAVATKWIADRAQTPFFFFLHLYEPHSPYEPPEPFASRYASSYDGEVAQTDAIVGRFLAFLKQKGIYDRALIVLVSDHGEGLGDHGEDEHGIFLYREALAVPMLIKLPGQKLAGTTAEVPAGLVDVAPTILAVAGLEPTKGMEGVPLIDDDQIPLSYRPVYAETYYPRFHFGWSELHSIVAGDDHFIDAPRPELYDMAADPGEKTNLVSDRRRRIAAYRRMIAERATEPAAPAAISSEEMEKLAALGYTGSAADRGEGQRPDPKEKIDTFRALQDAFRLSRAGKDAEALAAFDRLLKDEADMVDLWYVRSKTLVRLGRAKEGIASAKEALRRNPAATHIAADLANTLLLEGELEDAQRHAELAVRTDPARAHAILGRVALARNDLVTAEAEAKQAVAAGGDAQAALFTLASVQQKKGDFSAVLATTERIEQPWPRGIASMRGDALARLGRERDAEASFRAELAAFPDSREAARRLVLLLVAHGRNEEATKVIRDLAAAAPDAATFRTIAETLRIVGDEPGARYWSARAKGES
ncbi:MAG TPA: sulfatase-like hydrolase/transferase [Thermoanaerobaculia bacterium]|nr:sulfatase-like hydrolase/transferase [Thermoanaerobaculia bacterium]